MAKIKLSKNELKKQKDALSEMCRAGFNTLEARSKPLEATLRESLRAAPRISQ